MRKSFLVIEPHADDAFLSLGAHIEEWTKRGDAVTILTLIPETYKRAREAEAFAAAVGAESVVMPPNENGEIVLSNWYETIGQLIRSDACKKDMVIPLGIQHEEHKAVRKFVMEEVRWAKSLRVRYYLDMPYCLKQKNAEEVQKALEGKTVISYRKPHARKWRHIPIFKSQAKFFHFNGDACKQSFEMVVSL